MVDSKADTEAVVISTVILHTEVPATLNPINEAEFLQIYELIIYFQQ